MTATKNLQFNTPAQARAYAAGMAQVTAKLAGNHKPTPAEIEAASVARGRSEILKKFGSAFYVKTFGTAPAKPMAPAAKPAASPGTVQYFAKETGPFQPRKLHIYTCRQWLAPLPA